MICKILAIAAGAYLLPFFGWIAMCIWWKATGADDAMGLEPIGCLMALTWPIWAWSWVFGWIQELFWWIKR